MSSSAPIGVLDSGIGGTTTLGKMRELMPHEDFFYYGDTRNNPYGEKSQEELEGILSEICDFLIRDKNVKMIVVACNTATTRCIGFLRDKYPDVPFVGTEPAVKAACDSGAENILVLATPGTVESERMAELVRDNRDAGQNITLLGCPGLADAIESKDAARISRKLTETLGRKVHEKYDAVVLGCTHYILIRDEIQRLYPEARIIDGNEGIARRVQEVLAERGLANPSVKNGKIEQFFTEK